tara:strand:- start:188 stop:841 length:654 start_codon:yes stop_codon:yes gene_type:complete
MAWDFAAQVHALTGFDADASTNTETGETYRTMTAQWLKDAAKEVINLLPPNLQKMCTATESFTSTAVGSEGEVLNTGKVFNVFAGNYEAREIPSSMKHKANDSDSLEYATSTDPIYYVENNKINVLPASLSCKYEELQFPTISFDDTTISTFPDEAEHLVVLKAAIIALEYQMAVEEDMQLYTPMIVNLKQDYLQGINALQLGRLIQPKKKETKKEK